MGAEHAGPSAVEQTMDIDSDHAPEAAPEASSEAPQTKMEDAPLPEGTSEVPQEKLEEASPAAAEQSPAAGAEAPATPATEPAAVVDKGEPACAVFSRNVLSSEGLCQCLSSSLPLSSTKVLLLAQCLCGCMRSGRHNELSAMSSRAEAACGIM